MAQAITDFVVGKLCDAVFEEIVALCKVGDKLESIKRELTRIQCFLKEADDRVGKDERVKNWVEELRGVSGLIEDAKATFEAEVAIWTRKEPGITNKIARAIGKPMQLKAKRKLGGKIDTILARIEEISKGKERYGIENLGERRMIESAVRVGPDRFIIPDLDDLKIVGFVADKEKIIAQLLDENIPQRSIVSIVGTGGLGKTTLAHKVYSSDAVKSRFKERVWLSISQEFKLIDLLKKILRTLRSINEKEETLGEGYFIGEVNQSLRNKKYLIVMDDVWSDHLWPQIVVALPDDKNGSRVLVTSRFAKIAKAADDTFKPYELQLLSKEESHQLLLKTALPNQDCPTYLLAIAKQLADKCERLPLTLVMLGGLLKTKPQARTVWEKLLKTNVWGTADGKKCMNVISTTYNDMPSALKACFMYLACFPEDFEIDARDLVRLWVAEDFIPQQPGETLEDTAEDYLEQLAERYMVIVVERRYNDSIRTIRVHDVLHGLAIDKAREDNFITVLSNKDVKGSPSTLSPRLSLQTSDVDQLMEHVGPKLESLHYYCSKEKLLDCSRYENLKVFNIGANNLGDCYIDLERSNYLRFFGISGTGFYLNLPAGQLRNIQTLDLRNLGKWDRELVVFIWGIETLRHVLLRPVHEISGPPSGAKLKNLQTLGYINQPDSWRTQLPHLTSLRSLKLQDIKLTSAKTIALLFQTLENLINLTLGLSPDFERDESRGDIFNMQMFPFYQSLQKLKLYGPWVDSLDRPGFILPPNLIKLRLKLTMLLNDPMLALEKLQCLKVLFLEWKCYCGAKMICSAGGFPCLEQLKLEWLPDLVKLKIEVGAMPALKLLTIQACEELKRLEIEEGAMPSLKLLQMKSCGHVESLPMHLTFRIEQIDPISSRRCDILIGQESIDSDEEALYWSIDSDEEALYRF